MLCRLTITIVFLTYSLASLAQAGVGESYLLGPDDQITIRVLQAPEIADKPVRIDLNGNIELPFIGKLHAAGLTIEAFRKTLTRTGSAVPGRCGGRNWK